MASGTSARCRSRRLGPAPSPSALQDPRTFKHQYRVSTPMPTNKHDNLKSQSAPLASLRSWILCVWGCLSVTSQYIQCRKYGQYRHVFIEFANTLWFCFQQKLYETLNCLIALMWNVNDDDATPFYGKVKPQLRLVRQNADRSYQHLTNYSSTVRQCHRICEPSEGPPRQLPGTVKSGNNTRYAY